MPTVKTSDILSLTEGAIEKLEKKTGFPLSANYQSSFDELARQINQTLNLPFGHGLKGDTLYRNVFLKVKRHSAPHISYSTKYLDGLSIYVNNRPFHEVFEILGENRQMANPVNDSQGGILIYSNFGMKKYAESIKAELKSVFSQPVHICIRDCSIPDELEHFFYKRSENDCIIHLIDKHYFQSENCVLQLLHLLSEDHPRRSYYLSRCIHLYVSPVEKSDSDFCIFEIRGRLKFLEHWKEEAAGLQNLKPDAQSGHFNVIQNDLEKIEYISQHLYQTLILLTQQNRTLPYYNNNEYNFERFCDLIKKKLDPSVKDSESSVLATIVAEKNKAALSLVDEEKIFHLEGNYYLFHIDENGTNFYRSVMKVEPDGKLAIESGSGNLYYGQLRPSHIESGSFYFHFYDTSNVHTRIDGLILKLSESEMKGFYFSASENVMDSGTLFFIKTSSNSDPYPTTATLKLDSEEFSSIESNERLISHMNLYALWKQKQMQKSLPLPISAKFT